MFNLFLQFWFIFCLGYDLQLKGCTDKRPQKGKNVHYQSLYFFFTFVVWTIFRPKKEYEVETEFIINEIKLQYHRTDDY